MARREALHDIPGEQLERSLVTEHLTPRVFAHDVVSATHVAGCHMPTCQYWGMRRADRLKAVLHHPVRVANGVDLSPVLGTHQSGGLVQDLGGILEEVGVRDVGVLLTPEDVIDWDVEGEELAPWHRVGPGAAAVVD